MPKPGAAKFLHSTIARLERPVRAESRFDCGPVSRGVLQKSQGILILYSRLSLNAQLCRRKFWKYLFDRHRAREAVRDEASSQCNDTNQGSPQMLLSTFRQSHFWFKAALSNAAVCSPPRLGDSTTTFGNGSGRSVGRGQAKLPRPHARLDSTRW